MGCLLYINNFSKAQNFLAEGIPKNMGFWKKKNFEKIWKKRIESASSNLE